MIRGRLFPGSAAPLRGEHIEGLARVGNVVIEQILDGVVDEPVDYDQDHDEWVVLLEGAAELEVNGGDAPVGTGRLGPAAPADTSSPDADHEGDKLARHPCRRGRL